MKPVTQFLTGIAIAIGSVLLVLSAMSLSLSEGNLAAETISTQPAPSASPTHQALVTATASQDTSTPIVQGNSPTPSATLTLTIAPSLTPSTVCPPPKGWVSYVVETSDTVALLAQHSGVSVEQIQKANCLLTTDLLPGSILYIPFAQSTATAQASPTATPCIVPNGWVLYTIQHGDTLSQLSGELNVTITEIMQANCLTSTYLITGMSIYVPFLPRATATPIPSATSTPLAKPTVTATQGISTNTPVAPTLPPTNTNTPSAPTVEPSATAIAPTEPPATQVPPTATLAAPVVTPTSKP